jgi:tRNA (guanine-N7-)-methyltransferase
MEAQRVSAPEQERSIEDHKESVASMPRRKLDRFPVDLPCDEALRRYYRSYDGATLYHLPATVPDITSCSLFGNEQPLVLDLGCGRGEFLLAQAQRHPEYNYVGFDWQRKYLYDAINHVARLDLPNVLFLRADLRQMMCKITTETASVLLLLFPPPVMKHKHQRKDLLTEAFVAELVRILIPGGTLTFITDHRLYFEQKRLLFEKHLRCTLMSEGFEGGLTWFQRVWERHRLPSLRAEYHKAGDK